MSQGDSASTTIKQWLQFVFAAVTALIVSPEFANRLFQWFAQFWQGFTRPIDPNILPYIGRARHSRAVMAQSIANNVVYIGAGLFVDGLVRQGVRYVLPVAEDSYAETGVNIAFSILFYLLATRCFIENQAINAAMMQAGRLDNPDVETSCECDTQTRLCGAVVSGVYALGETASLGIAERVMPIMRIPNMLLFGPALHGRRLTEVAVADRMCTTHRNQLLNQNNPYNYGVGVSFQMALLLGAYAPRLLLNVNVGPLAEFAMYYMLHQYYLMLVKSNDRSLPGRETGVDISWFNRQITRGALGVGMQVIGPMLSGPGEGIKWEDVERALRYYPVKMAGNILLGADVTGKDVLIKTLFSRPHMRQLFMLHHQMIKDSMRDLEAWRRGVARFNAFIDWVPESYAPEYKRRIVKLAASATWEEYQQKMLQLVEMIARACDGSELTEFAQQQAKLEMRPARLLQPPPAVKPVASVSVVQPAPVLESLGVISDVTTPAVSQSPFDVASALKAIARQPFWNSQGTSFIGKSKPPYGINKLRAASPDLESLNKVVVNLPESLGRAPVTQIFYDLIKDCYQRQRNNQACKDLIEAFCMNHLSQIERQRLNIPGLQFSSGSLRLHGL